MTRALRTASGAGPEPLIADLRKIETAGQKLLAMLAGVECTIAGGGAEEKGQATSTIDRVREKGYGCGKSGPVQPWQGTPTRSLLQGP